VLVFERRLNTIALELPYALASNSDYDLGSFVSGALLSADCHDLTIALDDGRIIQRPRWCDVYRAPPPTSLQVGAAVRIAYDDDHGARRWFYGNVKKVHAGGQLVDLHFDNREFAKRMPLFHLKDCSSLG